MRRGDADEVMMGDGAPVHAYVLYRLDCQIWFVFFCNALQKLPRLDENESLPAIE